MFDVFSRNEFRLIRQACQVHGQQALKLLSFFFFLLFGKAFICLLFKFVICLLILTVGEMCLRC